MSTASKKANLARIRDNQRRSRARRKDYLQELEARLRQCELQGIEASAEIQIAARKVADENKKLRSLLAQHGIVDDTVDAQLQSSSSTDITMAGQCNTQSPSVQVLEQLLSRRKACCADGNEAVSNGTTMGRTVQREDSSFSGSTIHSLWDPVHTSRSVSVGRLPPVEAASSAQQFMAPSASNLANLHNNLLNRLQGIQACAPNRQQHHQAHLQSYTMTPVPLPRTQSRSSSASMQPPSIYDFDQHLHANTHLNLNSPQVRSIHPQSYQINAHPSNQASSPGSSMVYAQATNGNANSSYNSCIIATDMITTMAGGDPSDISADLGCLPGVDCSVDNQLVFNVMDRHTVGV